MIISMEYKIQEGVRVDLSKGVVVLSPSLFFSFFPFSIFLYFIGGLNGSFYLTLICPLWDLLNLSSLGSFPHLRATLYFTRRYRRSSHFTRYSNHKEDVAIMMYAMYATASVAGTCMT